MVGNNVNEAINYVLTRMADERGITSDKMQAIIDKALHRGVTPSDPAIRRELVKWFGGKEPSAEEFIEEIAKMIDIAHHDE